MEKAAMILLLCSLVMAMKLQVEAATTTDGPEQVQDWFQTLSNKTQKSTKLHFFFHDTISGKNPTAVPVVRPNETFFGFGTIFMMDDPLTVGPELNSTQIGRAQGIYAIAGQKEVSFLMTLNYVFTSGEYEGSTLSILGRNSILDTYREMPIVGGTGVFRLARGVATAKTYWINVTSADAIVEYNVHVLHY